jgi:hypothetical protein
LKSFIKFVSEEAREYPAPHLKRFHEELADMQRDKPEHAMLRAQSVLGQWPSGNALGHALEHVGDMTHRMAQRYCEQMSYGREMVRSKVNVGLRVLENRVDRERIGEIPRILQLDKYAEEHAKLPVFNDAQFHAREAAVHLGRGNYDQSIHHLKNLEGMLDNGTFEHHAAQYNPDYAK